MTAKPPAEQTLRATYDISETCPTVAGKRFGVVVPDGMLPGRPEQRLSVEVEDGDASALEAILAAAGCAIRRSTQRDTYRDVVPRPFVSALRAILNEANSSDACTRGEVTPWDLKQVPIDTKASEGGPSVHIAKRRKLEAFLREQGVKFEVSCQTIHSASSCALATAEPEPTPAEAGDIAEAAREPAVPDDQAAHDSAPREEDANAS